MSGENNVAVGQETLGDNVDGDGNTALKVALKAIYLGEEM